MEMRIDELAQRAGTTSRNIRAYQERGLLPPPELKGRTGYYTREHLDRLDLIDRLQARGFSLEAIRHTLDAWSRGGDLSSLIGFQHLLTAPVPTEEPQAYAIAELLDRFPEVAGEPALLDRALELGLLEPARDGTFLARSPLLIEAGTELVAIGVPLAAVLELVASIRPDLDDVARRFVGLVRQHVIEPIVEGQVAPERVGTTVESVRKLKPIALEVVRPFLAQALEAAIDDAVRAVAASADEAATP